jgi:hypothetical protein
MPIEVELSAFRLVERLLENVRAAEDGAAAGSAESTSDGRPPVTVLVVYGAHDLHVTVSCRTGAEGAGDPAGPLLADLGERVDAVGGRLVVRRHDDRCDVHAWFPASGVATSVRA